MRQGFAILTAKSRDLVSKLEVGPTCLNDRRFLRGSKTEGGVIARDKAPSGKGIGQTRLVPASGVAGRQTRQGLFSTPSAWLPL